MRNYISDKNGDPIKFSSLNQPITLLCGNIAVFDMSSGISYRCENCSAVVGSVGMPKECQSLYEMERMVEKLKGNK